MNSEKLSARSKQPGHDRTFEYSESAFVNAARLALDPAFYEVEEKPRDLRNLFPPEAPGQRPLGIELEAVILNTATGRQLYVEVKKQGDAGNADERACKHHTVQFYKTMRDHFGYDYHPIVTVFCESLAVNPRYTRKSKYYFEENQYFNWVDYDQDSISVYLNARCAEWLSD